MVVRFARLFECVVFAVRMRQSPARERLLSGSMASATCEEDSSELSVPQIVPLLCEARSIEKTGDPPDLSYVPIASCCLG